jgi:hypothetical protein
MRDAVTVQEILQLVLVSDKLDLLKFPRMNMLKSRHLFPGADAAPKDGTEIFTVVRQRLRSRFVKELFEHGLISFTYL